jgi:hypothetical protein
MFLVSAVLVPAGIWTCVTHLAAVALLCRHLGEFKLRLILLVFGAFSLSDAV